MLADVRHWPHPDCMWQTTHPPTDHCHGSVRTMFIQTEPTPNPDSLKFLPGKEVLPSGSLDFRSFRDAQASPLAKKIFQMEGVTGVFLTTDFVTVSKNEDAEWQTLKPQVFAGIMDFYAEGEAILANGGEMEEDSLVIHDDDPEVRGIELVRPCECREWV